ncbi:MAG: PEGA domain-containing protein [Deltaproteobacteria bacterium]|nr:PEGA domain-containing protein [Deltaproteobacteria bacterium]
MSLLLANRPRRIAVPFGSTAASLVFAFAVFGMPRAAAAESSSSQASSASARLEIRTSDGLGTIHLDGREVGQGTFAGDVAAGSHEIRVSREGFDTFEKKVQVAADQLLVETIVLERSETDASPADAPPVPVSSRAADGIYGGLNLGALFMPRGSDNTIDLGCESIGATSCEPSKPMGALAAGYVGYALEPIGLELFFGMLGDVSRPKATFDGVRGSDINPLAAAPARTEEFIFARYGGFAALRSRVWWDLSRWRVSFAGGVGAGYNRMAMRRTAKTDDGGENVYNTEQQGYWSPLVTLDLSIQLKVGKTSSLSLGGLLIAENASGKARVPPAGHQFITGGTATVPRPVDTPSYDMASGPQIYLGPYVGVQLGP